MATITVWALVLFGSWITSSGPEHIYGGPPIAVVQDLASEQACTDAGKQLTTRGLNFECVRVEKKLAEYRLEPQGDPIPLTTCCVGTTVPWTTSQSNSIAPLYDVRPDGSLSTSPPPHRKR